MADFDVNTITVQGAVAIASATAGDKLVIDGCDATTDVLTQAQAVQIATRPASPASTTDTIGLAGSTDNHVYAYASFIRGESTGGDVNSFLLYGHMESDATNVFVVAVASATAPTHIPTSSDVTNRVEIQFELTFSATDEVVTVTDTSMYTTRGEFLILKNRTVTTHAEGQATVGEDQTIYGKKKFMDDMIFNGMYQVQAKVVEGQNTQNMFAFTQNGERQNVGPTITALTTYNGTDYVSSTTSIGAASILGIAGGASFSAEHKAVGDSNATMMATRGLGGAYAGVVVEPTQVTLYTQAASGGARKTVVFNGSALEVGANVYAPSMAAEKFELLNASAFMEWDAQSSAIYFSQPIINSSFMQEDGNVLIDDAGVFTDDLNPMSGSTIDVSGNITPASNNTYNLGSSNPYKRWKEAHLVDVFCERLFLSNVNLTYDEEYDGLSINTSIFPYSDGALDLGDPDLKWRNVHAKGLSLPPLIITPNVMPNTDVPVGCVLLVYLYIGAHAQNVYHAPGTEWTSNGNNMAVGVLTESGFQRMTDYNKIKSGYKFVLLSGAFSAGGSTSLDGTYVPALVRRIA